MIKRSILLLLLLLSPLLHASPQTVVTLSPHAAELVYFAGGSDRLVAVSAYTDFPESLQALPVIGDANGFDREKLLQLNPDLVVAWRLGLNSDEIRWLRNQGFELYISNPLSLNDIETEIAELGELFGTENQSSAILEQIAKQKRDMIEIAAQRRSPFRVMHQLWSKPLIALTDESMVADLLEYCGIETPVSAKGSLSVTLSREILFTTRLDGIVVDHANKKDAINPLGLSIYTTNTLQLHRASPRAIEEAVSLCEATRE